MSEFYDPVPLQLIEDATVESIPEAVREYKVMTDTRTPEQQEVDRFLHMLRNGTPKRWARPLVWLLRKVVL